MSDRWRRRGRVTRSGVLLLGLIAALALLAPWLAPNDPERRFPDHLYAPPSRLRLPDGEMRSLHVHPQRLVNRLERRFEEDRRASSPLRWLQDGRLLSVDERASPLLLLGADSYGRDIFARLLYGARISLALAILATIGATAIGLVIGAVAGLASGVLDETLSRADELVLMLPAIYMALALRAALPLVLGASTVFVLLVAIFALIGWPIVARGVRAIVVVEGAKAHVEAGRALGASRWRLLTRHLLPASRGYVLTQASLLLPAFIIAEATLSYVGLGFPETTATWGTMLQEASNAALLTEAPWMLAPALAIYVVVLAVNLAVQGTLVPDVIPDVVSEVVSEAARPGVSSGTPPVELRP